MRIGGRAPGADVKARFKKHSPWLLAAISIGLVIVGLIVHNARYGPVSPRISNPDDTGRPHPLSDPLFGYSACIKSALSW